MLLLWSKKEFQVLNITKVEQGAIPCFIHGITL